MMVEKTGPKDNPDELGKLVGQELQKQGVDKLALNWREKVEEWNNENSPHQKYCC